MSKEIGKCLCGRIEVECDDLPKNVVACYCEDCQKASGGGPSFNILIPDDLIRIIKGNPSVYEMKANSGNLLKRLFCSYCGTAICSELTTRTVWKAGLFSHSKKNLEVVLNVWSSSANNLCRVDKNKETYEQGR